MSYNTETYREQGGKKLHVAELEFEGGGLMPNQADSTAGSYTALKEDFNDLLVKLKNAGLMVGDAFTLITVVPQGANGDANRVYNQGKVTSVAESNGKITITLSEKVADLKDSDGGSGWGVHKWIGIGISAGITLTDLEYNGTKLTADDITEATACSLDSGYFVRWVAADLVLAENNSERSVDNFTLRADGYAKTNYKFVIVEPEE